MRALVCLALVLGSAGCVERPPTIEVRNASGTDALGTIEMWLDTQWRNDTSQRTGEWTFEVAPGATASLGRLPREPAEYHYMVVRTEDGREGWGRVLNHAHASGLLIEITDTEAIVHPQGVT